MPTVAGVKAENKQSQSTGILVVNIKPESEKDEHEETQERPRPIIKSEKKVKSAEVKIIPKISSTKAQIGAKKKNFQITITDIDSNSVSSRGKLTNKSGGRTTNKSGS